MTTTLMHLSRGTQTITAEHHPHDRHGAMRYSLHVHGGRAGDMVIHCRTELSVVTLFNEIVTLHGLGVEHPYLVAV